MKLADWNAFIKKVCIKILSFESETAWLTQAHLAELFQTSRPNITMHIKNILEEGELQEVSVCKDFLHTAADGKNYNTTRQHGSRSNL